LGVQGVRAHRFVGAGGRRTLCGEERDPFGIRAHGPAPTLLYATVSKTKKNKEEKQNVLSHSRTLEYTP